MKLMTLKDKLDAFIGLISTLYRDKDRATLSYIVPSTGAILFDVHLINNEGWKIDSTAFTFNYRYAEELRNMHKEE